MAGAEQVVHREWNALYRREEIFDRILVAVECVGPLVVDPWKVVVFKLKRKIVACGDVDESVMRSEAGNGERKRRSSSASCVNNSKQLIRSCASVPACQDCGRFAMDPQSLNHQQEPGVTDCVSGEQHLPMPQNVPWTKAFAGADSVVSQRCESYRIVYLHVRSAVPQELLSLCGALPPSCELPRRRADNHLLSISSEWKRRHLDHPFLQALDDRLSGVLESADSASHRWTSARIVCDVTLLARESTWPSRR